MGQLLKASLKCHWEEVFAILSAHTALPKYTYISYINFQIRDALCRHADSAERFANSDSTQHLLYVCSSTQSLLCMPPKKILHDHVKEDAVHLRLSPLRMYTHTVPTVRGCAAKRKSTKRAYSTYHVFYRVGFCVCLVFNHVCM